MMADNVYIRLDCSLDFTGGGLHMNGSNDSWVKKWLVPLATACCVMALVLLTVPITGIPATVMGGYGGGGGIPAPSPAPAVPVATVAIGPVSFTVPTVISIWTPGTVSLVISGPDAAAVDPASLTFAGAPVQSMYFDTAGNLVVIFDKSKMNLKPGDTSAMITGNLKSGMPFGGAIPVTVVP
jgi:hypothetical protein